MLAACLRLGEKEYSVKPRALRLLTGCLRAVEKVCVCCALNGEPLVALLRDRVFTTVRAYLSCIYARLEGSLHSLMFARNSLLLIEP